MDKLEIASNIDLNVGIESMKQHVSRLRGKNKSDEAVIKVSRLKLVRLHSIKCELPQHLKVSEMNFHDALIVVKTQEIGSRKKSVSQLRTCIRSLKRGISDEQS